MPLYGILGGIDGNLEALRSVLAAFDERGVKKLLCVGNVVGYNADADECGELLRARRAVAVAADHDGISTGMLGFGDCPNQLRHALKRTRRDLRADTAAWLRALPAGRSLDDGIALGAERARIRFVGGEATAQGQCRLDPARTYVISPGSVDAQRKPHRFAECAIFDSHAWTLDFLRLRYDAAATEAKAAVGGYRLVPAMNALYTMQRLVAGLPRFAYELGACRARVQRRAGSASPAASLTGVTRGTIIGTRLR